MTPRSSSISLRRALWHHEESYPCSWQLDPTEGPFRMRKRLQRCHLEIAPKFFMDDAPAKSNSFILSTRTFFDKKTKYLRTPLRFEKLYQVESERTFDL